MRADLLKQARASVTEVLELEGLLAIGEVREYKFTRTAEQAGAEPFLVLHTSGSTGLPKPIVIPHSYYFSFDNQKALPQFNGFPVMVTI